jgi:hypothetical protein
VATSTPVAAVGDRLANLLGPRSMITFDLGVEFPYQGLDYGIGIQWATHGDRSAWYLMHGASRIFKKEDATAARLGSVGFTVGWSWDSRREACLDGKRYSWGIPIKLAGPVGIGLACARDFPFADFGGLALTIMSADYQRLKPVTTSPGGVVPLPLPGPNAGFWALGLPKPKLEGGFGYEGAILLSNPNDSQAGIF